MCWIQAGGARRLMQATWCDTDFTTCGKIKMQSTTIEGSTPISKVSQVKIPWLSKAMVLISALVCWAALNGWECQTISLSITCECMKNVLLQYCAHTIAIKNATMERCAVVIFEPYFFKLVLCCRLVKNIYFIFVLRCKGSDNYWYLSYLLQCFYLEMF